MLTVPKGLTHMEAWGIYTLSTPFIKGTFFLKNSIIIDEEVGISVKNFKATKSVSSMVTISMIDASKCSS